MSVEFKLSNFFISPFEHPINFEFSSLLTLFVFPNTVREQADRRSLTISVVNISAFFHLQQLFVPLILTSG